jgi:hypothetical protein
MSLSIRAVSSLSAPHVSRGRGGSRLIASQSFASILESIEEAPPPATVATAPSPVVVSAVPSADRAVLMQFTADLAAAPEIAGELVALYVEQYPRLAIWFAGRAVRFRAQAAAEIEAAARWRETCGLAALAELIRAALAIACPRDPEGDVPTPAVILDLDIAPDEVDDWQPGAS